MKQQNIYDNPEFFAGYSKLRENDQGFNKLLEQPAIRSLLPNLKGYHVADLGCGFGDLCRFLQEQGAESVLGIDISEKMLEVAQANTDNPKIKYIHCAIENLNIADNSIDLVVSSLALHYIENYTKLVQKVFTCLKNKGYFIFSVEHPICTSHATAEVMESNGKIIWPINNYRNEGEFKQTWFVKNVIKYHRKIESYLNALINAGFHIEKILEPMPTDEQIANRPEFYVHKIRPPLLIIRANKVSA